MIERLSGAKVASQAVACFSFCRRGSRGVVALRLSSNQKRRSGGYTEDRHHGSRLSPVAGPHIPAGGDGPRVTIEEAARETYASAAALARAFGSTVLAPSWWPADAEEISHCLARFSSGRAHYEIESIRRDGVRRRSAQAPSRHLRPTVGDPLGRLRHRGRDRERGEESAPSQSSLAVAPNSSAIEPARGAGCGLSHQGRRSRRRLLRRRESPWRQRHIAGGVTPCQRQCRRHRSSLPCRKSEGGPT